MPSLRHQRVQELLKREIGEVIRREIPLAHNNLVSVNDVGVARDLKSALVYVGILGKPDERRRAFEQLLKEQARIQDHLARRVVLRYTPKLRFALDETIDRGNRVLAILDEIERKDSPE